MKIQLQSKRKQHPSIPWGDISPEHICKCWDLYKSKKMTTQILLGHFPGRSLNAIRSKVWSIRGRIEQNYPSNYNPDQEDLFRLQISTTGLLQNSD